jgi:hypothetical protein
MPGNSLTKPLVFLTVIGVTALPALGALPVAARARAERVPQLAVESSCHAAELYGILDAKQTFKSCMADEDQAKSQLEKSWGKYKAKTKRDCITAGAAPSPSYVELLTCIEMTEEILKPPSNAIGGGGGAGSGAVGGSPPQSVPLAPGPRAMPH